jgi:transcriptional regulator with XRE-family HTH domain
VDAPNIKPLFGKALKARREKVGLTQEQLAHAAGLHWTYISQIERGVKSPTLLVLHLLARGLGTTKSSLMVGLERLEQRGTRPSGHGRPADGRDR